MTRMEAGICASLVMTTRLRYLTISLPRRDCAHPAFIVAPHEPDADRQPRDPGLGPKRRGPLARRGSAEAWHPAGQRRFSNRATGRAGGRERSAIAPHARKDGAPLPAPASSVLHGRPPRIADRGRDFRTLPQRDSSAENALLDALRCDETARQSMVHARRGFAGR